VRDAISWWLLLICGDSKPDCVVEAIAFDLYLVWLVVVVKDGFFVWFDFKCEVAGPPLFLTY
jgi:hypothetical protein